MTFDPSIPLALWVPLAVAALGLMAWYAWDSRERLSGRTRAGVVALMALALAVPLGILLNPTWLERIPPPPGKPLLSILVDRSASMATPDAGDGRTRYDAAGRLAARAAGKLAEKYEIRVRCFAGDSSLVAPGELSRHEPDGAMTDLGRAIDDALDDARPQGQAILLLSDGVHNAGSGADSLRRSLAKAGALAAPVYVTTIGGPTEVRDLSVSLERPRELAFVGQRVPVTVRLHQRGSLARRVTLAVVLNDKVVEERPIELTAGGRTETTFEIAEEESGLYRYEIRADPLPQEVTSLNNRATLLVRVVDEPIRVLLLEGKPYWDTKFLIRTLSADPSIELVSMVQMAEGRLLERRIARLPDEAGQPPEKESPQSPENESPQPSELQESRPAGIDAWTIRQDAGEVLGDPKSLASYQIVVLGRDAEVFLSEGSLLALEKWLKQRECSLVCFRGAPSSQISERLDRLMPVRWTPSRESRFRVRLTPSSRDMQWLPQAGDTEGLAGLPSLATVAQSRPRGLAQTLAEGVAEGSEKAAPVITHVRVGMGRVVVVEGAGMWRWAFLPPKYQQHDETYGLIWRSLIRWLVANVELLPSQKLALKPDKVTFTTAETATAHLLIREEHLGPEVPEVELTGSALAEPKAVQPVPSGSYPGQFRVTFGKLPEGRYQARMLGAGDDEPAARTAFDVRRGHLEELLQIEAKPEQMELIADRTGGLVLPDADPRLLDQRFGEHLKRSLPERITQTTAWDRWWVLLGVFALCGAAWGLRRGSGLV